MKAPANGGFREDDDSILPSGSSSFLYRSVMERLRARIESRQYPPGSRIPTVGELAEEFLVSSITIRRAIRDLSLEGLVVTRQGLGAFVANRNRIVRTLDVDRMTPFEEEMRSHGVAAGLRDLGVTRVTLDDDVSLAGLYKPGTHLFRLERLLLADGEAVGFDTLWLPSWLATKLKNHLHGQFIMSILQQWGMIERIDFQLEASTITETQAPLLGVVTGSPLLVVRFFPFGKEDRPILSGRMITRADRFTYVFGTRVGGPAGEPTT